MFSDDEKDIEDTIATIVYITQDEDGNNIDNTGFVLLSDATLNTGNTVDPIAGDPTGVCLLKAGANEIVAERAKVKYIKKKAKKT